jgi:nicotinamidase-related amidase
LKVLPEDRVIQKGAVWNVDSYSGFGSKPLTDSEVFDSSAPLYNDNGELVDQATAEGIRLKYKAKQAWAVRCAGLEKTDLETMLLKHGIKEVFVVGLAFDYCVAATAKDALALGYKTSIICNCIASVARETADKASAELIKAGIIYLGDYTPDTIVDNNIRVLGEAEKAIPNHVQRLIGEVTEAAETAETEEQAMKKAEEALATLQTAMDTILKRALRPDGIDNASEEALKRLEEAGQSYVATMKDVQRKLEEAFPTPPSLWTRFKNWVLRR